MNDRDALIERVTERIDLVKAIGSAYVTMLRADAEALISLASPSPAQWPEEVAERAQPWISALNEAREQFLYYAKNHRNKTPPDTDKAAVNEEMAARMEAALATLPPPAEPNWYLVDRRDVVKRLSEVAERHADLAISGDPSNARGREAAEAALTRAKYAVAFMPAADRSHFRHRLLSRWGVKEDHMSCAPVIEADRGRPQEAPSWERIESAPKDGTWIIAALFGADGGLWWVSKAQWTSRWSSPRWWDGIEPSGLVQPSHYQNMPNPWVMAALGPSTANIDEERA